jgi:hypothetical protein
MSSMNAEKSKLFLRLRQAISKLRLRRKSTYATVGAASPSGTEEGKSSRLRLGESLLMSYEVFKIFRRGSHMLYYLHRNRYGVDDVTVFVGIGREAWRVSQLAVELYPDRDMI